jgi:hypothetical protein
LLSGGRWATAEGGIEAVEFLLKAGADTTVRAATAARAASLD